MSTIVVSFVLVFIFNLMVPIFHSQWLIYSRFTIRRQHVVLLPGVSHGVPGARVVRTAPRRTHHGAEVSTYIFLIRIYAFVLAEALVGFVRTL